MIKKPPSLYFNPRSGEWETAGEYQFEFKGYWFTIPRGFSFDLSSVPRILTPFVNKQELGICAPLIHDFLYVGRGYIKGVSYSRQEADRAFYQAMLDDGINRAKAWIAYRAVRNFGWTYWYERG